MKITKTRLNQIIKEEIENLKEEGLKEVKDVEIAANASGLFENLEEEKTNGNNT